MEECWKEEADKELPDTNSTTVHAKISASTADTLLEIDFS